MSASTELSEEAKAYLELLAPRQFSLQLLAEFSRPIGELAASTGDGQLLLLGMLDGGLSLTDVIEALVMHGELPAWTDTEQFGALSLKFDEQANTWKPTLPESV